MQASRVNLEKVADLSHIQIFSDSFWSTLMKTSPGIPLVSTNQIKLATLCNLGKINSDLSFTKLTETIASLLIFILLPSEDALDLEIVEINAENLSQVMARCEELDIFPEVHVVDGELYSLPFDNRIFISLA